MKKIALIFFLVVKAIVRVLMYFVGYLLFLITRPLVSLSHVMMGNYHTAKDAIIEYEPRINALDWL